MPSLYVSLRWIFGNDTVAVSVGLKSSITMIDTPWPVAPSMTPTSLKWALAPYSNFLVRASKVVVPLPVVTVALSNVKAALAAALSVSFWA